MRNFIDRRIVAEYCRRFNALDSELYRGDIPNAEAEEFLTEQIPRFDCPDPVFREIWYFRWWCWKNWMDLKRQRAKKESMQEPQSESWNGTGRRVICYRE